MTKDTFIVGPFTLILYAEPESAEQSNVFIVEEMLFYYIQIIIRTTKANVGGMAIEIEPHHQ